MLHHDIQKHAIDLDTERIRAAVRALNIQPSPPKPARRRHLVTMLFMAGLDATITGLIATIPPQGPVISGLLGAAAGAVALLSMYLFYTGRSP